MKRLSVILALICLLFVTGCVVPFTAPSSTLAPTASPSLSPSHPSENTPTPSVQPSVVGQLPQSTQTISRDYAWDYGGRRWTWQLQLPQALYDYYKGLPRPPTSNYSVYVTHPLDDAYLGQLVTKIQEAARQESYSEFETVGFAASFVQSLPYVSDNVSTAYDEYPRYPIETLVDNGGDCEDTSILMASLIKEMGYGVVLLRLPGHVAVGVAGGEGVYGTYWEYEGRKYYYLETTGTGWGIGEIPEEYRTQSASVYEMKPVPILTHTWTSTGRAGFVDLQVMVSNLGSAAAQGVYVFAGFDAGDNQMWNPEQSPLFQVGVDEKVTVTMSLRVPYGEHTRVVVQIVYNGYAVDESHSMWFDT